MRSFRRPIRRLLAAALRRCSTIRRRPAGGRGQLDYGCGRASIWRAWPTRRCALYRAILAGKARRYTRLVNGGAVKGFFAVPA